MKPNFGDILSDLDEEKRTGMVRVALSNDREFGVGSPFANDLLKSLKGDEKIGARAIEYNNGDIIVQVNLYKRGSIEKFPMSRSKIVRWRVEHGGGPYPWNYQARYASASCASSGNTRNEALVSAKRWIDEQIEKTKDEMPSLR